MNPKPTIDDSKLKRILQMSESLQDVPWDEIDDVEFLNDNDKFIYSAWNN